MVDFHRDEDSTTSLCSANVSDWLYKLSTRIPLPMILEEVSSTCVDIPGLLGAKLGDPFLPDAIASTQPPF